VENYNLDVFLDFIEGSFVERLDFAHEIEKGDKINTNDQV
jgi:hypothetical protein